MYVQLVKEQRRRVARVTLEQQKKMATLYKAAAEEIAKEVISGQDLFGDKIQLMANLDNVATELHKGIYINTVDGITEAAKIGTFAEEQVAEQLFGMNTSKLGYFTQIQHDVVANIIDGNLYGDNFTLSQRLWYSKNELNKGIDEVLAQGIAQKKSAVELARDLEEFLKHPAERTVEFFEDYPMFRFKAVDWRALRLARTSINHSYQTATIQASEANPYVDGIRWRSAGDHRTCPICAEREGVIFPKDNVPLDHPNGRCTMLPHIEMSFKEIAADVDAWKMGREKAQVQAWFDNLRS